MEEFEGVVIDEEDSEVVEKPSFLKTVWGWVKDNPGVFISTGLAIGLEAFKLCARRHEYEDYLYVTTDEDEVARIPAKKMRSVKHQSNRKTFRHRKR